MQATSDNLEPLQLDANNQRCEAFPSEPRDDANSLKVGFLSKTQHDNSGEEAARDKSPEPEQEILYPWPKQADRDYECISSCGSGTFAQVYRARARSSGQLVAVKVMAGDKWALQEAAILRGLDHENICKMIDCFSCDEEGVTCLVMQYASGGDLLERMINSGPLTERAAADLARQILLALQYMHSKGVLHRDLKPENILWSSRCQSRCGSMFPPFPLSAAPACI